MCAVATARARVRAPGGSSVAGRTTAQEQYAFFYRTALVSVGTVRRAGGLLLHPAETASRALCTGLAWTRARPCIRRAVNSYIFNDTSDVFEREPMVVLFVVGALQVVRRRAAGLVVKACYPVKRTRVVVCRAVPRHWDTDQADGCRQRGGLSAKADGFT